MKQTLLWVLLISFIVLGSFAIWIATLKIPNLESFEERKITESTKIYDRTGEILLYDIFEDIKRTVVPFENISQNVKNATLAIEDVDFYSHNGVKPSAFLRAVLVNFGSLSFSQGGSTITQQVIKNSLLTSEKKISRKIKEWVLAIKIEKILEKDEIFSIYLNEIPYGGNIYGIEEASQAYFNKPSSELTLAEAAYMASLPKAPSYYSPYNNRERLDTRKDLVLKEMLQNNFITEDEYKEALEEEIEFEPRETQGIKAPHFVLFVRQILEEKYGSDVLQNSGLKVITSLDYEMQEKAEELAKEYALDNKEKFNAENLSLVAIDPQTGDILTMVGSRDYFDEEIDGNFNVAIAHRQPGSSFKPFAYAEAFNKGYTPETVLFDLKTQFSTACLPNDFRKIDPCFSPDNYDNIFRGPVTMRNALAQSINVPAVKVLYLAGLQDTLNLAKAMGIQELSKANTYGLTLVLGGGEVSLLDMTSAYGVFANSGIRLPYRSILKVEDKDGKILEEATLEPRRVLPEETAWKISDILSDNIARTPAFGGDSYLNFPGRDVAVKTGTTNDYKDAWIVGYTPSLVVGAWAGNNDNSPMEKKVAGFIVAPFWNAFMQNSLTSTPNTSFTRLPQENSFELKPVLRGKWNGGESILIDKISGKLATEYTPQETITELVTGEVRNILYWVSRNDPRGEKPVNPESDPQFIRWDYPVRAWAISQGFLENNQIDLPDEYDDIHTPENFPDISFIDPRRNESFSEKDIVRIRLEAESKYKIVKMDVFVDDSYLGSADGDSLNFSFIPEEVGLSKGKYSVRVIVTDEVFNKTTEEREFEID